MQEILYICRTFKLFKLGCSAVAFRLSRPSERKEITTTSGGEVNTTTAADTGQCAAARHHSRAGVGGEESKIGNAERVCGNEEGRNVKKWDDSG